MSVYIAKLTEKIELQELTISATTYGQPVEVWTTFRTIWGTQQAQKGKLLNNAYNQYSMDYISLYCRYTPFNRKGTAIFYNGQRYKTFNVNHVPFREATIIDLINYT